MVINMCGIAKDKPVNIAKGAASNAGLKDFSLPNILVAIIRTISGKKVLTTACGTAVQKAKSATKALSLDKLSILSPKAVVTGVPTAPKDTAVESKIKVIIAAASGGNPRHTSKGPASAAGVPKPAADSINEQKEKPIMQACTRLSGQMFINPRLIAAVAPDAFKVFITKIAPEIIINTSKELSIPKTELANNSTTSIFHDTRPKINATQNEISKLHFARRLNTSIKTSVKIIGTNAKIANIKHSSLLFYAE